MRCLYMCIRLFAGCLNLVQKPLNSRAQFFLLSENTLAKEFLIIVFVSFTRKIPNPKRYHTFVG